MSTDKIKKELDQTRDSIMTELTKKNVSKIKKEPESIVNEGHKFKESKIMFTNKKRVIYGDVPD